MKLRELRAVLRRSGFTARCNGGSHEVWESTSQPGCVIVLAGQDGKEAHKYQRKKVLKVCTGLSTKVL